MLAPFLAASWILLRAFSRFFCLSDPTRSWIPANLNLVVLLVLIERNVWACKITDHQTIFIPLFRKLFWIFVLFINKPKRNTCIAKILD